MLETKERINGDQLYVYYDSIHETMVRRTLHTPSGSLYTVHGRRDWGTHNVHTPRRLECLRRRTNTVRLYTSMSAHSDRNTENWTLGDMWTICHIAL
jgi:hypothetical protein